VCTNLKPCVGIAAVVLPQCALTVWATMEIVLDQVRCTVGCWGGIGDGSGVLLGLLLTTLGGVTPLSSLGVVGWLATLGGWLATLGGAATASLNAGWLLATLGSGVWEVAI
jgi:hypothetical protein